MDASYGQPVFAFRNPWRLSSVPAELRRQLEAEGIIFLADRVGVSRHFSGHVPGVYSAYDAARYRGAFALTGSRVVATLPTGGDPGLLAADCAWDSPGGPATLTVAASGLRIEIDLRAVDHAFSGSMSLRYRADIPEEILNKVPKTTLRVPVDPVFVYRAAGSGPGLTADQLQQPPRLIVDRRHSSVDGARNEQTTRGVADPQHPGNRRARHHGPPRAGLRAPHIQHVQRGKAVRAEEFQLAQIEDQPVALQRHAQRVGAQPVGVGRIDLAFDGDHRDTFGDPLGGQTCGAAVPRLDRNGMVGRWFEYLLYRHGDSIWPIRDRGYRRFQILFATADETDVSGRL
jgi:hypothetical protein